MNRDPHLPPPEVCDWLLSQNWSEAIPLTVITYPAGHPDGIYRSEKFDYASTSTAIGSDEIADVFLPVEVIEVLRADQVARDSALDEKRRKYRADEEMRKLAREESRKMESAPKFIASQEIGSKVLEILGVEPNLVANMTIELNPEDIAKCHITRWITMEEAGELLTMFEEEQYCLMQLEIDKE